MAGHSFTNIIRLLTTEIVRPKHTGSFTEFVSMPVAMQIIFFQRVGGGGGRFLGTCLGCYYNVTISHFDLVFCYSLHF